MGQESIFISPHHDDICFSLACTVHAVGGGTLVNLFSRSRYVAQPYESKLSLETTHGNRPADNQTERSDVVSQIRRHEDEVFCQQVGLKRLDLGLEDTDLRGHKPFKITPADLAEDVARVTCVLRPALEELIKTQASGIPTLFCPMGIGGHRDHLACLHAVLNLPTSLLGHVRLQFYEDLHYSSNAKARSLGLKNFLGLIKPRRMMKVPLRLSPENLEWKMDLVHLYQSQHYLPLSAWDYTPADSSQWGAHEAIWVEA